VENRNHHKRDASSWQEDRHRHRQPNAALNLALTRNVLLALIPFEEGQPLGHFFAAYHRHPRHALRLILKTSPVLCGGQPNTLTFVLARSAAACMAPGLNNRLRRRIAHHARRHRCDPDFPRAAPRATLGICHALR
jgi:hypothetical protein